MLPEGTVPGALLGGQDLPLPPPVDSPAAGLMSSQRRGAGARSRMRSPPPATLGRPQLSEGDAVPPAAQQKGGGGGGGRRQRSSGSGGSSSSSPKGPVLFGATIDGLEAKPELNGQRGAIVGWLEQKVRRPRRRPAHGPASFALPGFLWLPPSPSVCLSFRAVQLPCCLP
eukprot:SAG22_NODE_4620_length_1214_cov_0.982960_1_plen_170_part_00